MNIFETIAHGIAEAASAVAGFFKHLFGADGDLVQKAIEGIAEVEKVAAVVVEDLHKIAPVVDKTVIGDIIGPITAYIEKHVPDVDHVKAFLESIDGLDVSDVLFKTAQFVVGYLKVGTSTTDLILAVITAYKVLKLKEA